MYGLAKLARHCLGTEFHLMIHFYKTQSLKVNQMLVFNTANLSPRALDMNW